MRGSKYKLFDLKKKEKGISKEFADGFEPNLLGQLTTVVVKMLCKTLVS